MKYVTRGKTEVSKDLCHSQHALPASNLWFGDVRSPLFLRSCLPYTIMASDFLKQWVQLNAFLYKVMVFYHNRQAVYAATGGLNEVCCPWCHQEPMLGSIFHGVAMETDMVHVHTGGHGTMVCAATCCHGQESVCCSGTEGFCNILLYPQNSLEDSPDNLWYGSWSEALHSWWLLVRDEKRLSYL